MSIREQLLAAFEKRAGRDISGEELAQRLGVSRVAVWKQVQSLKALGFPISSQERSGYRFLASVDNSLLDYSKRRQGWCKPHYFFTTHSTQWLAKEGGQAGLPEGHLWIAETQSKGRGRLERAWESSYGGLWFSLLLRPRLPASSVPPLTLLAGLSLSKAIEKVTGVRATLKWPNDLIVGKKKLAGILTEMSGQIDQTDWVVIGVGLNVNNTFLSHSRRHRRESSGYKAAGSRVEALGDDTLTRNAISLKDVTAKSWRRTVLLQAFFADFMPSYARFQKQGFAPFQVPYWARYSRPQHTVRIKTSSGVVSGVARGVDASGGIMIESRRKIDVIREGEISL